MYKYLNYYCPLTLNFRYYVTIIIKEHKIYTIEIHIICNQLGLYCNFTISTYLVVQLTITERQIN